MIFDKTGIVAVQAGDVVTAGPYSTAPEIVTDIRVKDDGSGKLELELCQEGRESDIKSWVDAEYFSKTCYVMLPVGRNHPCDRYGRPLNIDDEVRVGGWTDNNTFFVERIEITKNSWSVVVRQKINKVESILFTNELCKTLTIISKLNANYPYIRESMGHCEVDAK